MGHFNLSFAMIDILHCEEGSVCGCPEWWGLCPDPDIASINTFESPSSNDKNNQASCQTLPSQPDESLTCFFWYHTGSCGRIRQHGRCHFAHHLQHNSVVEPPPGYAHESPCELPLCPLRVGSGITVWSRTSAAAEYKEAKISRRKKWRERIKEKKRESRLLGADLAADDCAKAKGCTNNHTHQQQGPKQQQALISLHGRGFVCAGPRPPASPESGELFSDEEAPDAGWYLNGFPDDNMADAECGTMEEILVEEDRVLQPGDVVHGPDTMSAMWHAAYQADADAPD